jgi:hypothetical protein
LTIESFHVRLSAFGFQLSVYRAPDPDNAGVGRYKLISCKEPHYAGFLTKKINLN